MWDCLPKNFILSFWGKSIGLNVLRSPFVHMEEKVKLNMEYIEIDPTILKNTANLLIPDWISNSGRNFYEWAIVFVYIQKFQVKIQHFYFASTHVTSSSFMYSASEVAISILNGEFGKYSTLFNFFVFSCP